MYIQILGQKSRGTVFSENPSDIVPRKGIHCYYNEDCWIQFRDLECRKVWDPQAKKYVHSYLFSCLVLYFSIILVGSGYFADP